MKVAVGASATGIIHVHTAYSHDGRDSIADLASWARERGIAFVAITDHAEDLDEQRWMSLVDECRMHSGDDLTLFPGLEFRFDGFPGLHLLACGLRRWITPATPVEFIADAEGVCDLTVGAHPGIWRRACPTDVLKALNAVEVWNGGYNTRYLPDPIAMEMVQDLQKMGSGTVATVGPDQHDRRNDKELRIVVRSAAAQALTAIREGRFKNHGKTMAFGSRLDSMDLTLPLLRVARMSLDLLSKVQDRMVRLLRRARGARSGT